MGNLKAWVFQALTVTRTSKKILLFWALVSLINGKTELNRCFPRLYSCIHSYFCTARVIVAIFYHNLSCFLNIFFFK